jgi:hypothetical protein
MGALVEAVGVLVVYDGMLEGARKVLVGVEAAVSCQDPAELVTFSD